MMSLVIFLLLLVLLIIVHEFGHFGVAKLFGIKVEEFSVFFPPKLLKKKWGETTYVLGALPFGGYVKIFGENPGEAALPGASDRQNFARRSPWVQAAVTVAGVAANMVLAWLFLSGGYVIGMPSSADHTGIGEVRDAKVTIVGVLPGSPAQTAGIMPHDIVEGIETGSASLRTFANASVVQSFIAAHADESMVVFVRRGEEQKQVLAKPREGFTPDQKVLGIQMDDVGTLQLPVHLALVQGAIVTWEMTKATTVGLLGFFGSLFQGTANFASVAGPVGIATLGSSAVSEGIVTTILLTAIISINLAVINLLPVPGLDGGRLLFIAVEGIRGRAISERIATRVTVAGFALLIGLMLLVTYHDLLKLWG